MQTISVLNQKGGVGKTTIATNLAAAAHLAGLRTGILDLDEQESGLDWYAARGAVSGLDGLTVVGSARSFTLAKFRELSRGLDVVVCDGPPRIGDVTRAAAVAADVVVIPLRPGPFDWWAAAETLKILDSADEIREARGMPRSRRVFVVNGAAAGTRTLAAALDALRDLGEVAPTIGNRVAFATDAAAGESVLTLHPGSPAAFDIMALWSTVRGVS